MILKSFEIQGFKSFPDKTVMQFNNGVTTVVGPNGSGKSNVAEAMRWVFGEQSPRALRCEKKMEELIFHGTQNRGPVGFAEVTIRLDNATRLFPIDQNEVSITRRLYRSGESEYYINKNSVRLKDVLDLFLGTGLGRDGYSIIGQGRIGEILSDKSADRRRVFEEAAGISRFRSRKEDAERKLDNAQENLVRIQDKIEELNLQREPLLEQADRARHYLLLHDEQRLIEISVWLENLDKVRADTDKVRRDFDIVNAQLMEGKAKLDSQYAQVESLTDGYAAQQALVEEARTAVSQSELTVTELESRLTIIAANIENCDEHIDRISQEISGQSGRLETLSAQLTERLAEQESLQTKLTDIVRELETTMAEAQERVQMDGDLEAQLAVCRTTEAALQVKITAARDTLSTADAINSEMSMRRQTIISDLSVRNQSCKENEDALAESELQLTEAQENLASLQHVLEGYRIRQGSRQHKVNELRDQFQAKDRQIESLNARLHILKDMEREFEGFPRAVKTVMQESAKGTLHGVLGTVSELLRVNDQYTVAIETALGNTVQNIVVEHEQDAKNCIQYLKVRNIGRATFLPLSAVRGQEMDLRDVKNAPGFVGLASQLVACDPKVQGVIHQLLGRTVVAEHMDAAIDIAKASGFRVRLVTLDGQIISAGGAMTGGSVAQNVGILSRHNEFERLGKQVVSLQQERDAVDKDLRTAERDLSAIQYELNVAQEEQRTTETSIATLSSEVAHKNEWLTQAKAAVKVLQDEMSGISERISAQLEQIEGLHVDIASLEKSLTAQQKQAEVLLINRDEAGKQQSDLSTRMSQAREQQAALLAQLQGVERAIAEYRVFQEELSGDAQQKEASILEHRAKKTTLTLEVQVVTENLEQVTLRREERRVALQDAIQAALQIEGKRNQSDKQTKEFNEQNLRLEREVARLEGKRTAAEQEEKQILDRFWESYGLTHQDALKQRTPLDSLPQAQRRIAELKREISSLGVVNIGAIEEFERVNERYAYLVTQSEDAAKAKGELLQILDEIVAAMKTIFSQQFDLINQRFTETFLEIFGGGQGYLELEDPTDILNCGIDIKVQPPGKRLGSLSPLSGGEKSLVAIALYFAIFKVNPAPFCVLDEVDHDLDDVNVARYAAYLTRMATQLQFVVITHRRGTMEVANFLYGVTAEQQGVSKILALDIAEVERSLGLKLK